MEQDIYKRLPEVLLPWYAAHRRDLPWRRDREPYHVWLSEIMLQQTRVEAVKDYYLRFLEALPTVEALASCEDDMLRKLWEGLGYYSRVRNLKKAAQRIVAAGGFPQSYEEVRALPGIGDYTAGAVCSICFDLPTPAVDGNVLRVIARLTGDARPIDLPDFKKRVRAELAAVYPTQAGAFTQALMELGATVCGPNRKPECESCPCVGFCTGAKTGNPEQYPVRLPKKEKRTEQMTVFILRRGDRYALRRRPDTGLLASLWEFPHVPGMLDTGDALAAAEALGGKPAQVLRVVERQHIFTHIRWQMRGYYLEVREGSEALCWMSRQEIEETAALPTAFRQFWEETDFV